MLRKLFVLADVGLRKRLGSSPYSFCSTLKQDFFWQGWEVTAYILRILFLTRDTMWQWIGSQQGLCFRLCVFPLLFRSGFRCHEWRFTPLLFHWSLGTERDKIQVIQGEWVQFGRTQAKQWMGSLPQFSRHWSHSSPLSWHLFRKLQCFHVISMEFDFTNWNYPSVSLTQNGMSR